MKYEGGEEVKAEATEDATQIGAPEPKPEVELFKTSGLPQDSKLKEFLQEKMTYKYNKYCIDCKRNQTTHFLVWNGSFVCATCAQEHVKVFGGNSNVYVKDVYNE